MNILVLAAHADDEVIGCGGTLARHVEQGDSVYLVIMADGVSSRSQVAKGDLELRDQALENSCSHLGIQLLHRFDFKDNQLDRYPMLELIKAAETPIKQVRFDCVYTHSRSDLNIDHRVVHDLALTLFRPQPDETVRAIYAFETLSATHWNGPDQPFKPQRFVDIEPFWEKKMQALGAYEKELRAFPHARSLEAMASLARFRGSLAGVPKAEAFEVIRWVESS